MSLSLLFFLTRCGCTGNLLLDNGEFEKKMQAHIGTNLKDKIGPLSIEILLEHGKYVRDIPEPKIQTLTS